MKVTTLSINRVGDPTDKRFGSGKTILMRIQDKNYHKTIFAQTKTLNSPLRAPQPIQPKVTRYIQPSTPTRPQKQVVRNSLQLMLPNDTGLIVTTKRPQTSPQKHVTSPREERPAVRTIDDGQIIPSSVQQRPFTARLQEPRERPVSGFIREMERLSTHDLYHKEDQKVKDQRTYGSMLVKTQERLRTQSAHGPSKAEELGQFFKNQEHMRKQLLEGHLSIVQREDW